MCWSLHSMDHHGDSPVNECFRGTRRLNIICVWGLVKVVVSKKGANLYRVFSFLLTCGFTSATVVSCDDSHRVQLHAMYFYCLPAVISLGFPLSERFYLGEFPETVSGAGIPVSCSSTHSRTFQAWRHPHHHLPR